MPFVLPPLPFYPDALAPWTSAETLAFHHGKHHAAYVAKLNAAVAGTSYEDMTLEEIVVASRGKDAAAFNNAAQHWNHSFFWDCLSPSRQTVPRKLLRLFVRQFGSLDAFKKAFAEKALTLFGSGWVWLVLQADGTLEIVQTKDAENPMGSGKAILLTLDVWEHAYYVDHRNDRSRFIEGFWPHVNWTSVASRLW